MRVLSEEDCRVAVGNSELDCCVVMKPGFAANLRSYSRTVDGERPGSLG